MENALDFTIPLTIGFGSYLAGRLIEGFRRRGDLEALQEEERDPDFIENYRHLKPTILEQFLHQAVPFLAGLLLTASTGHNITAYIVGSAVPVIVRNLK